jgi:pimeloyl-ACP methyl ester carboxylesterase
MAATTTMVLTTGDRELCIESGGDVSGRAVLVHAGTPGSRLLADPWLDDAAQRGIHLISYDRPGYGGSTAAPGRRVADCADDVRAVAAAFGLDRLAVWGISGGGPHALACAALLPDLVCAVASLASVAPYGEPGLDYFAHMGQDNVDDVKLFFDDPAAARAQSAVDRDELLAVTPEQIVEAWASLLSPVDAAVLRGDVAPFLLAAMKVGVAPGDQGWWDDGWAHLNPWGFSLDAISVPVQLWQGRQDRFVPFQHGQWLAEHIPGVDAHLTDDDGHLTLFDRLPSIHHWLLQHF